MVVESAVSPEGTCSCLLHHRSDQRHQQYLRPEKIRPGGLVREWSRRRVTRKSGGFADAGASQFLLQHRPRARCSAKRSEIATCNSRVRRTNAVTRRADAEPTGAGIRQRGVRPNDKNNKNNNAAVAERFPHDTFDLSPIFSVPAGHKAVGT